MVENNRHRNNKSSDDVLSDELLYLICINFHCQLGLYPFREIVNSNDEKPPVFSRGCARSQNVHSPLGKWYRTLNRLQIIIWYIPYIYHGSEPYLTLFTLFHVALGVRQHAWPIKTRYQCFQHWSLPSYVIDTDPSCISSIISMASIAVRHFIKGRLNDFLYNSFLYIL